MRTEWWDGCLYCIDTSALIAGWQERYPLENFPRFWKRIDSLINSGHLDAPVEVLRETKKRSDELHEWLSEREHTFRELEDKIQVEAASVLALVGERKLRSSADPFVIALARVEKLPVITDEKPTGNLKRPNIPDVCTALGMPPCMGLLQLIQAQKWVIG